MKKLERFETIFLVSGVGFFILAFVGMGLAPWTTLKNIRPSTGVQRTAEEEEGRNIFMHEACWHCHTQFVRPVSNESLRYGPVSTAMEYGNEIPQLFGTRRVGPDLSRESGRHSNDWHLAHLKNPRATTPWSIMPAFPWLSDKKAKALTAYLQSLGRQVAEETKESEENFRKSFAAGSPPPFSMPLLERGKKLFARECVGCHGTSGDGKGVASGLLPQPADLTLIHPTLDYVFEILNTGIPGSAMPKFSDYPARDLWAMAYTVIGLSPETQASQASLKGKQKFHTTCSTCHGENGKGDGAVGINLRPQPPDFHRLRPTAQRIRQVLENGVPGTAMPSFSKLSAKEKESLIDYVVSITEGAKEKETKK